MAEEPNVKKSTEQPELSDESRRAMEQAQREGRRAVGVDIKNEPGKSTKDPTARGFMQPGGQGLQQDAGSKPSTSSLPKYGLDDEKGNGLDGDLDGGESLGSDGKRSRSPKEPYHYDGLYGEMPENGAAGGSPYSSGRQMPFGRGKEEALKKEEEGKEGENDTSDEGATPTKDGVPTGDGSDSSTESGASDLKEQKPEGEEGEKPDEGKEADSSDESNPELDNAKAVARDEGLSDDEIDKAQKAAEGVAEKMDNKPDAEKAIEEQLDENDKKQRLEDEEKGGSSSKKSSDDKEKEEDPEEKAKEEGTDAAAAGMASNPNAMNQGTDPTGNGYKNPSQQSKMDEINRRNLEHNQQVNNAQNGERPKATDAMKPSDNKASADSKAGGDAKAGAKDGAGAKDKKGKFKGKAGAAVDKAKSAKNFVNNPFKWGANKAKNAIINLLLQHPMLLFAIIFAIFFMLLIFVLLLGGQLKGGSYSGSSYTGVGCSYTDLKGITTSGSVSLNGIQVELINCDGKEDNYTVLEKIDFEKYVVGVALAEVSWSKSPEYFKAQIVAARGFALRRNSAMCPSHPDNCFYGYNSATNTIRLRACTNDQVYCDPDKPCYHYTRSGKPTIYGPEAEGMAGATVWKGQLSEQTKADVMAAAKEVEGKVLVDGSGNVVYTNFVNTDQNQWYEMAQQGMKWDEILIKHYSSSGASGYNSATCQGTGNIDYGNYSLKSDGDVILNQRLDTFLASKGTSLDAFNALIASNVDKAGFGTRAGVVAAAVTLIGEMGDQYNTKIPYFLSGGHHDGVRSQALGYWGSGYEDDGRQCYYTGYGNVYTVCGLDCSGFVPWAIKTGGFNPGVRLAGNFQYITGARRVSLSSSQAVLEPGDLLESEGHIVLVIGIDQGAKQYICAEASGKNAGVLFTRRPFSGGGGYWGVKMDGYYENKSNVRSK